MRKRQRLTTATQQKPGTLSLTADRWLKSGEVRFFSRKFCTCWIRSDSGFKRFPKMALGEKKKKKRQSFTVDEKTCTQKKSTVSFFKLSAFNKQEDSRIER